MAQINNYKSNGIILASQSPRRKQLLEWAEVAFEIIVQSTDESFPGNIPATDAAIHIAKNKALAVSQFVQGTAAAGRIILAADTIVVINNKIIGKPISREHAIETLQKLSGKTHRVITGVVMLDDEQQVAFADTTEVSFYELSKESIAFYVDKYKPYDKAGAYAIQEWIGVTGIESIKGDFYNVMGLPVSKVVHALGNW